MKAKQDIFYIELQSLLETSIPSPVEEEGARIEGSSLQQERKASDAGFYHCDHTFRARGLLDGSSRECLQ